MTQTRILEQIGQLPIQERLDIIEGALRLIRQDLRRTGKPQRKQARKAQLAAAARALLPDYAAGGVPVKPAQSAGCRSIASWARQCEEVYHRFRSGNAHDSVYPRLAIVLLRQ